ncbi:MAG TPA: hypothetical protein VF189_04705 [Patescibacteria group bacterium]
MNTKQLALSIPGYGKISTPGDITAINNLSLNSIIRWGITMLLYGAILLSFIFILIAGLKWITSQGDKKALEGAHKTLTMAIGGLILALLAYFIINLVGWAFGVRLLG